MVNINILVYVLISSSNIRLIRWFSSITNW